MGRARGPWGSAGASSTGTVGHGRGARERRADGEERLVPTGGTSSIDRLKERFTPQDFFGRCDKLILINFKVRISPPPPLGPGTSPGPGLPQLLGQHHGVGVGGPRRPTIYASGIGQTPQCAMHRFSQMALYLQLRIGKYKHSPGKEKIPTQNPLAATLGGGGIFNFLKIFIF